MLRKLMILPWFGEWPPWMTQYLQNVQRLKAFGYDWLFWVDLEGLQERCRRKLGVEVPLREGEAKSHDLRPAFGILFGEEIKGYDFWGFTDLDCVYGRVWKWVTAEFLEGLDIHSNHHSYMCGPWSLLRNEKRVNELFLGGLEWKENMEAERITGWGEQGWSRAVESSGLRYKYTYWQGNDRDHPGAVCLEESGALIWMGEELMMYHFRRGKEWPIRMIL